VKIGILGTGTLATALGAAWAKTGHDVVVAGRSADKAAALAERLGVRSASPLQAVRDSDAVLLAVSWSGVAEMLTSAGAQTGGFEGITLIDPSNAVEHGVGVLLTEPGRSAAEQIGVLAPGARVVKAFHLFAAGQWVRTEGDDSAPVTVVICGDDPAALELVSGLVHDVGAQPAVLGSLARARQLEEVAGFVIGLAFNGADPRSAVPHVP
jgi:predicted dinucleotide-binding enzyme